MIHEFNFNNQYIGTTRKIAEIWKFLYFDKSLIDTQSKTSNEYYLSQENDSPTNYGADIKILLGDEWKILTTLECTIRDGTKKNYKPNQLGMEVFKPYLDLIISNMLTV